MNDIINENTTKDMVMKKLDESFKHEQVLPYTNYIKDTNKSLEECDPELNAILGRERHRQRRSLELIPSENFTSKSVLECLKSVAVNKYSEGYPGSRYYGGTEYIDELERLCQNRALECFNLNKKEWAVNVQPHSGSPANFAAYTAILKPHMRLMGLALPDGGHITHGHYIGTNKISGSSIYFESMPYRVDPETGYIDYDKLLENAKLFQPQLIIGGSSAYTRKIDYKRLREISDIVGAKLLGDISHTNGIIACGLLEQPFDYCDVVTMTTHKFLRGPRSALIFTNIEKNPNLEKAINSAVFPGLQGGPHQNQIAGVATQLKEILNRELWYSYVTQVLKNSKKLAQELCNKNYKLVTGGTDNHMIVLDCRSVGLNGSRSQFVCDAVDIAINKNCVPGDKSPLYPSGIRLGIPAMTTRGCVEKDMEYIADFIHDALLIGSSLNTDSPTLAEYKTRVKNSDKIAALKSKVNEWCWDFHMPGFQY